VTVSLILVNEIDLVNGVIQFTLFDVRTENETVSDIREGLRVEFLIENVY
jgi:hypothetical protein